MSETLEPSGSKFRLPSEPSVIEVTPDMASDWLSYRNHPKNRTLSKAVAGKYQKDMEQGRWRTTPEPMIFDTEGWIISGQHRLKAVANSMTIQSFWIVPGQSREIFDVVDQGYKRQASQVLGVPNSTTVAAGARFLAALADANRWGLPRYGAITVPEIIATVRKWPELNWYSTEVTNVRLRTYIPGAPHLAILAQAARTEHIGKIKPWLEGLASGTNLAENDARWHLRERFLRSHSTLGGSKNRDMVYSLIVKAWNVYAEERPMTILRQMATEPLALVAGNAVEPDQEVA